MSSGQTQSAISNVLKFLKQVEGLWQDQSIHSYSIRRHSHYERSSASGMKGALDREGIDAARENSKRWVEKLPENAQVTIYQSPSFQHAKTIKDVAAGQNKDILPQRATITASIYEKELHGNQQPGRRVTEARLGDFF